MINLNNNHKSNSGDKNYNQSGFIEALKKEIGSIKLDIEKYKEEIEKQKKNRSIDRNNYYDFNLDIDFSKEVKIFENRKYYYRAFQYRGIGLFKKEDIPWLKISLIDLSLEILNGLLQFTPEEREYIGKEAYGKIFEEVNFKVYHNSIASVLKVKFIDGSEDYGYTIIKDDDGKENKSEELEAKRELINQILLEQEKYYLEKQQKSYDNNSKIKNSNYAKKLNKDVDHNENNNYNNNKKEEIDLLQLIKEYCHELFIDQYNNPHVAIKIKDHNEVLSLNSKRLKHLFFKICYNKTQKINAEKIDNIIDILKAEAITSENIKNLDLRVGKVKNNDDNENDFTLYYDLTNSNWSIVKITSEGWSVLENDVPILFKRYNNQKPQVNPEIYDKDDVFDKFMDLLNIQDKDMRLLLKCYIISLFIHDIAKPILMLHGEQGSAKSTLQELIKMLVDPSIIKILSFPRDVNELVQQLSHTYIAYYDNISFIRDWISNELCRAVTGSGFSKRELFTNDDDIIYTFQRCIGFNGINLGATKADLLDRGLIIQLFRISKEKRRKIEDIRKDLDKIKSKLLGYIFHILVKVLQVKKEKGGIELTNGFNRMADFEEYAEIISRCMGYPENEFIRVYQDNIGIQIDEAIEANPLSTAIMIFINNQDDKVWQGTATELLDELNLIAQDELKINIKNNSSWVKSANQLSRRLNEVKTNLRDKGIHIEKYKNKDSTRILNIWITSSTSSNRPESDNQAQEQEENMDDTSDDTYEQPGSIVKQNMENQAQRDEIGLYGDKDDTLHINAKRENEILEKEENKKLLYHCNYCDNFKSCQKKYYDKHVLHEHPGRLLYPNRHLLQQLKLKPKGNPWE